MIRRISYRSAITAFVFTGLWFVLGLLLLWSPIPSALGIRGHMFIAWLALFLLILAGSGAMLTMASINGIFPPDERPQPKPAPAATATHTADGQPQPWSKSPLPERPARRTLSTSARPRSPEPPARQGR
jgi:hypothetical protein